MCAYKTGGDSTNIGNFRRGEICWIENVPKLYYVQTNVLLNCFECIIEK